MDGRRQVAPPCSTTRVVLTGPDRDEGRAALDPQARASVAQEPGAAASGRSPPPPATTSAGAPSSTVAVHGLRVFSESIVGGEGPDAPRCRAAEPGYYYKDLPKTPEGVAGVTRTVASNAAHVARLLKGASYPPA